MNRALLLLPFLVLAFSLPAAASAKPAPDKHDRDVIRFFLHHPALARSPAGSRAMWGVLAHVSDRLRTLQAARANAGVLAETGDWVTAVRVVQRVYPGSEWWLLSCSASEGGHGGFVMNSQGSGAGGQMQYMEGTFWGDFNAAVRDLASRGVRVPRSAWSWSSPLGQAVAAGWAYSHDRPRGKWTGGGC